MTADRFPFFFFDRVTDPHRALGLAVRSIRQLAVLSIVIGGIVAIGPGLWNPLRFKWFFLGASAGILIGPGLAYVIALRPLRQNRVAGLVIAAAAAGIQCLAAWVLAIAQLFVGPISLVPLLLSWLWAAAMTELLCRLAKAYRAIRCDAAERRRGFEVALPAERSRPRSVDAPPDKLA